jgi:DNA-binding PadR family transcriptional regulator
MVGPVELNALGAIKQLGRNAYGSKIRVLLSQEFGRDVAIGQVYVTLGRLQRRGFISSQKESLEPHQYGRAKLVFRLEGPGKKALEMAAAGALQEVGESVYEEIGKVATGIA